MQVADNAVRDLMGTTLSKARETVTHLEGWLDFKGSANAIHFTQDGDSISKVQVDMILTDSIAHSAANANTNKCFVMQALIDAQQRVAEAEATFAQQSHRVATAKAEQGAERLRFESLEGKFQALLGAHARLIAAVQATSRSPLMALKSTGAKTASSAEGELDRVEKSMMTVTQAMNVARVAINIPLTEWVLLSIEEGSGDDAGEVGTDSNLNPHFAVEAASEAMSKAGSIVTAVEISLETATTAKQKFDGDLHSLQIRYSSIIAAAAAAEVTDWADVSAAREAADSALESVQEHARRFDASMNEGEPALDVVRCCLPFVSANVALMKLHIPGS